MKLCGKVSSYGCEYAGLRPSPDDFLLYAKPLQRHKGLLGLTPSYRTVEKSFCIGHTIVSKGAAACALLVDATTDLLLSLAGKICTKV